IGNIFFFIYRRLKPLGLNLLLNTNCGVLKGRELVEQHRKYSSLYINDKTKPARQSKLQSLLKSTIINIIFFPKNIKVVYIYIYVYAHTRFVLYIIWKLVYVGW